MKIKKSSLNIFNGVGKAYMEGQASGKQFYAYDLNAKDVFKIRMEDVKRDYRCDRKALVAILKRENALLGAGPKVMESIEKLLNADTYAVVTGQQAGFLTGPMYTVFKAVTAIKLADQQSKLLGKQVVPVFWVASEDHDFQEVASTYLATQKLEKITIRKPHHHSSSVGHIPVNRNIEDMTEWFVSHLEGAPFNGALESALSDALKRSNNLAQYFNRIMTYLFDEHGLILLDPLWDGIRQLQIDFMKTAILHASQVETSFKQSTEKLLSEGYPQQLNFMENCLYLFRNVNGDRQRLEMVDEQTASSKDGCFVATVQELIEDIEINPTAYSMNVALRPVGQDVLLPTLAYVAGPGELNYYSQLKDIYGHFDLTMPIIYPRENFTLIEKTVDEGLGSFGLEPDSVIRKPKGDIQRWVLDQKDSFGIDQRFDAFIKGFDQHYNQFVEELKHAFPEIEKIESKNKALIHYQMHYLEKKVHQKNRKRHQDDLKDLNTLLDHVSPQEHLQERCFNYLMYHAKYGSKLLHGLIHEVPMDSEHRLIYLDASEN